jgi:short-subunit dehydrogenase
MTQTVLITGASGGIGYELATLFAKDGYDLVLIARNEKKLRDIAADFISRYGVSSTVLVKDLTRATAPREIYEELQAKNITIDILINNAGFGLFGEFLETNLQEEMDMIQVNVAALTHMTKLFLPQMVQRGAGRIMNVASMAAFQPGPLMAVYYATKAYVLSFSEALENELRGSGVTVTALCPGTTKTDFETRANLGESKLFKSGVMDVHTVAKAGYDGLMHGKTIVVPGTQNLLLTKAVRFMPRKLVTSTVRKMQERV